jgi:hypothetical protein
MTLLGRQDDAVVLPLVVGISIAVILLTVALPAWFKERRNVTLWKRLERYFGKGLKELQPHDKQFPGYDLASLSRALDSFLAEFAETTDTIGCVPVKSAQALTGIEPDSWHGKSKPSAATFERLPVDVDEEASFVSNCLYFVKLRPAAVPGFTPRDRDADAAALRVAILLSYTPPAAAYEEEMDSTSARPAYLDLGIACPSRAAAADFFFDQVDQRRRRLSVYRGKVIDPHVSDGGIQTIAFRRIQPVAEADLVLPDSVKALTHGAIVSFYRHADALRTLGVDLKRGVLFHSPPGTGKTSISLYLAGMLPNFTVCFVSGRRLLYPREVCGMARYLQPTMLVFEDIDLVAQERDMNGLATVLGELMNQIDGCEPNEQVLFVMNTNSMDRIEQAVKNRPGRIDQIIHIPLPDVADRARLLRLFSARFAPSADEIDGVAAATDGATPAMLKEIVKRAAVSAVARVNGNLVQRPHDQNGDGEATHNGDGAATITAEITITAQDLLLAYEQVQYLRNLKSPAAQIL